MSLCQNSIELELTTILMQDLLRYSERTEIQLRAEAATLAKSLEHAHLDLDDARESRRNGQMKLSQVTERLNAKDAELARKDADYNALRVSLGIGQKKVVTNKKGRESIYYSFD